MRLTLLVGVAMGLSMAALTQVPFGGFVVIVLLLCCSALFSGSETALFSLQPLDRKSLTEAGHTRGSSSPGSACRPSTKQPC